MSYQVRNPTQRALRHRQRALVNLLNLEDPSSEYQAIPGDTQKRVTNSSNDKKKEKDETSVTFEEAVNTPDPNQPVVRFSTRDPYYPTGYSCEHSLFYERNGIDENVANTFDMLSHSEDAADNDRYSISLHEIRVPLSLEFDIPIQDPNDYNEIISNVEALQWSLLNKLSSTTGLSKGCKIDKQYDEQTLVTALTNINNMDMPSKLIEEHGTSNDSNNNNRQRTRQLFSNRSLRSTLPYPTSVYSIASTRPKWTGKYKKNGLDFQTGSYSHVYFYGCLFV